MQKKLTSLIHIGLPTSESLSLRKGLSENCDEVDKWKFLDSLFHKYSYTNPLGEDTKKIKEKIRIFFEKNPLKLISSLRGFGDLYYNLFDQRRLLKLFKELFPETFFLITPVNQLQLLDNLYYDVLRNYLSKKDYEFLNFDEVFDDFNLYYYSGLNIDIKTFDWNILISGYESIIEREKLLVMPVENLYIKDEREKFISLIKEMTGKVVDIPDHFYKKNIKKKYADNFVKASLLLNRFVKNGTNKLGVLNSNILRDHICQDFDAEKYFFISRTLRKHLKDYYSNINREFIKKHSNYEYVWSRYYVR